MTKLDELCKVAEECGAKGMTAEQTFAHLRENYDTTALNGHSELVYDCFLGGYGDFHVQHN